jgi:hypothetical protein
MPTFTPPAVFDVPPVSVADDKWSPATEVANPLGQRLMRFFGTRPRGQNIFLMTDGTVANGDDAEPYPATDQQPNNALAQSWYGGVMTDFPVENPVVTVFYGGHSYEITTAQAATLTAAGYGANIT